MKGRAEVCKVLGMAEELYELSMGMSSDFDQAVSRALLLSLLFVRILKGNWMVEEREIVSCWIMGFIADQDGEQ